MTKTWLFKDLETVVKKGTTARLPVALLNRLVREATAAFEAKDGAIAVEDVTPKASSETEVVAVVHFDALKGACAWGVPAVAVTIEQHDDQFAVRVGGRVDTGVLGYSFGFGWTDETPAALFSALFACVLESVRTQRPLK